MKLDSATIAIIFGVLFGISEALGGIPSVKANSVYQLIVNILATLAGKNPDGSNKS